jgi:prevent-host-death family protein
MKINIHQAKTHLSKLLQRTMAGEEIIIARAGVPIARLVSIGRGKGVRPLDLDRGVFEVPEDFDAPLPPDLLAAFEGEALPRKKAAKRGGKRRRA